MPRFFFDTYDSASLILDDEGLELKDLEVVKREAQAALAHMARDGLPDEDERVFIISVRDEAGQVVLRAALSLAVEYPSKAPE
jgi:hypothetical protein